MELTRLDPESGGVSRLEVAGSDEIFLGRNPTTQITDTSISRKHASISFDKNSQQWKLKVNKLCYFKSSGEIDWSETTDYVNLSNGDIFSLLKDRYIYSCKVENDSNEVSVSLVAKVVESEKPKNVSPVKKKRILPAWMLANADKDVDSLKKESKTPVKQVTNFSIVDVNENFSALQNFDHKGVHVPALRCF